MKYVKMAVWVVGLMVFGWLVRHFSPWDEGMCECLPCPSAEASPPLETSSQPIASASVRSPSRPAPSASFKIPEPDAPEWTKIPPPGWDDLRGKWTGPGGDAHIIKGRKFSSTPWNIVLKGNRPKDWFRCGFYESGKSFCRGPDTKDKPEGRIEGILNFEFDRKSNRLKIQVTGWHGLVLSKKVTNR